MTSLRTWTPLQWVATVVTAVLTGVIIGVPTGIIDTPFYTRMTPVLWWNYPVWVATAVLEGLVVGSFIRSRVGAGQQGGRKALSGGVVSLLAVGCPICNKVVVLLVGVGGALSVFAPLQPYLALASLALIGAALWQRLRSPVTCESGRPVDRASG